MKKLFLSLSIVAFSFALLSTNQAWADVCGDALKAAAEKAAKDKDCQKDAKNIATALGNQIKICKDFRNKVRACRKVKRDAVKDCRKLKGQAERDCKKKARDAKKICKDDAKNTQEFAICKDARKLTKKAVGNALKCALKYFLPAVAVCVAQAFSGSDN